MNERVVSLLEEKDRTLGAIGHDLRTPLASLRIRAESVEPEEERERMIATIEEMTATLEDILDPRAGRPVARAVRARRCLRARRFGRRGVSRARPRRRRSAPMARHLLERPAEPASPRGPQSRRQCASNMPGRPRSRSKDRRQASASRCSTAAQGLPREELERVTGAFYRGEPSRNRETGGAGLGLSIARAVADAHGGTLTIENREGGGLAATISLPA